MGKIPGVIAVLIAANVVFAAVTFLMPGMEVTMFAIFALYFPSNPHFHWWQFVTNMFMHGGFAHLLFNMYALWAFGSILEQLWGKNRFLVFYFLSGIGASIVYTLVNYYRFTSIEQELASLHISSEQIRAYLSMTREEAQNFLSNGTYETSIFSSVSAEKLGNLYALYNNPAVGASGAIYGILVAFGMMFPNAKLALIFLPVPIAAKYFIPGLIALDLFSGVTGFSIFGGGVAHFGHVGGAIIGFLLMWFWRKKDPPAYAQYTDVT